MREAHYTATRTHWEQADVPCHADMRETTLRVYADEVAAALGLTGDECVVDIGCGDGQLDALLRQRARRIDGIDVAETKVRHARAAVPDGRFWRQSFLDPVPETGYDAAFSFSVMQYCLPADLDRFVERTLEAVRPGGVAAHVAILDRGRRWTALTRGRRGTALMRGIAAHVLHTISPRRIVAPDGTRFVDVDAIARRLQARGIDARILDCPYDRTRRSLVVHRPVEHGGGEADAPTEGAWQPTVSVVIPTLNEAAHIEDCLRSVLAQTYPAELVEILVADGGSTDDTQSLVRRMAENNARIRLVENPRRNQAAGMNVAIEVATGEVIARLDGHASWPRTHLARCIGILDRTGADSVGGTMDARGETAMGAAIALASRSRFGAGGAVYRYGTVEREVDTVWLGCFRREALRRVGPFDERLPPHEDYELNARIRATGGRIVFSPQLPTVYWTRPTLRALGRQYFRYGTGKARANRVTPGLVRAYHLAPVVLVAAVPFLAVASLTRGGRRLSVAAVAAYGCAVASATVQSGRGAPPMVAARIPLVFPTMHMAWGLGFITERLRGSRRSPF